MNPPDQQPPREDVLTPVRREFLKSAGTLGLGMAVGAAASAQPAPPTTATMPTTKPSSGSIPMRPFGRAADVQISALGMGGHHLGEYRTVEEAISAVHEAIDGGITFFDNCWEYYNGQDRKLARPRAWWAGATKSFS